MRLSVSNAALLSSSFVLLPVCVRCEAKDPAVALKKVEEITSALRAHPAAKEDGVEFVAFEEPVSPRLSRIDVAKKGKDSSFSIPVSIRARFPTGTDFWSRVAFVNSRFEKLTAFALVYENAKGTDIFLEEARLEHQKDAPDRFRIYRK